MANESINPFDKVSSIITITGSSAGSIVMKQDGKGNSSFTMGDGKTGALSTVEYNGHRYSQSLTGGPWTDFGATGATTETPDSNLTSLMSDLTTTKFTKQDTEACGSLNCLKYQITDATTPGSQTMWIDTSKHLLRQYSVTGAGDAGDMTMKVDYQPVTITIPSPVQSLNFSATQ